MNILNPAFKYTNSAHTDIRKLFDRVNPKWNVKPTKQLCPIHEIPLDGDVCPECEMEKEHE